MNQPVDLIALGGLGEIGLNMMVLEHGTERVIIDCGLMFPEEGMYGVDVVIPDFTYLLRDPKDILGVVITHGHEDHIGALPFLLRQVNVPVYCTRLTLELVRERLKEHQLLPTTRLEMVTPDIPLPLGPFTIEFIPVSHSIPDSMALGITTPQGRILHTGDFKIEQSPISGQRMDLARLAAFGKRGVMVMLSDSTNVERPGYTISERNIGQTFREIFRTCHGRIIVACFASSLTRIQQVVDVAAEYGRRVAFDGKSMILNVQIAKSLGYLNMPEGIAVPLHEIRDLPDHGVVLITTGSQGEPMSALTRMAQGDHKKIHIKRGDTVILSSRFIPGNERAITSIINTLYRRGAEVIYEKVRDVHVSGHAYQEELKLMINMVGPRFLVPVHGEFRHLIKHVDLAHDVGLPEERTILAENGDRLRLEDEQLFKAGRVETGRTLVDGKGVGDVGQVVLKDRRHLAEHGIVICLVVIDESTGEILVGPEILSRGFVFEESQSGLLEDAKCLVIEVFDRLFEERDTFAFPPDVGELSAEIHRNLKRFFYRVLERRPVIVPQLIAI